MNERKPDLVCLSQRRWGEATRTLHPFMTRLARERRVVFIEEPLARAGRPTLDVHAVEPTLLVMTPSLPPGLGPKAAAIALRELVTEGLRRFRIEHFALWTDRAAALEFSHHLVPVAVVYDRADQPPADPRDALLRSIADVVLEGPRPEGEAAWDQAVAGIRARLDRAPPGRPAGAETAVA